MRPVYPLALEDLIDALTESATLPAVQRTQWEQWVVDDVVRRTRADGALPVEKP